jgi:hypothetical protein
MFTALVVLLLAISGAWAQNQKQEKKYSALDDVLIGMQGIQQAGQDPVALAQLMKDLQVCLVLDYFTIP